MAIPPAAISAPSTATDEELLHQYHQTGQRSLFEQLISRYEIEIFSYLRRYLGNAELAEDAFQSTFLQVHLKSGSFDSSRRFRPWVYAIATNQAIDVRRKNKRHNIASLDRSHGAEDDEGKWSEKLVAEAPDPFLEASLRENGQWVHQAVETLSDSMRQVVELVYYQGLKYREAAEALDVPVGTVKSRLHAAVQRLRQLWEESHASAPY